MSWSKEFFKGIIKENPTLVMLLGTCPTLAMTTQASNALGMGIATTFVLLGSCVLISLLKNVIPSQVRLPCYIVIIAGFVTLVSFLLQVYVPELYSVLGVFLSLITVNCIILGRAEAFASKNSVGRSAADALGMGAGFTLALLLVGSVREILGTGSWFGIDLTFGVLEPIPLFATPAGGFMVFGLMVAVVNRLSHYQISKKKMGCAGCAGGCAACAGGCASGAEQKEGND